MSDDTITPRFLLDGFAAAAQTIGNTATDPRVKVAGNAAAVILRLASKLLDRRTPEQVQAVLQRILDNGVQPLKQAELDEQTERILAELAQESEPR